MTQKKITQRLRSVGRVLGVAMLLALWVVPGWAQTQGGISGLVTDSSGAAVPGAPDLRGTWKVITVEVGNEPAPASHPAYAHVERIEQCDDRLVVTGGGVIHDMRCDGTEAHGVHDVMATDFTTPITVVATYEDRRLDGDDMIWCYLGFTARLRRIA